MTTSTQLPATQTAVRIHAFGGRDQLVCEDAPIPRINPDDVLVKIHAASVNPVDWKVREGYLKGFIPHQLPLILGWDFAGEVVALGAEVKGWNLGDAVYARPDIARDGSYAEYIAVRASEIAHKPASLDWQEAAAVPLAALTAWQALYEIAAIKEGERVLIHAGSGGVGSFAIQLAKLRGAYVYTTTSSRNIEHVKNLGADEVIDYTARDFSQLRDLDVVFDTLGGDVMDNSWQTLKRGGRLVSIIGTPDAQVAERHGVTPLFCFVQPNATQLAELARLFDAGKLQVTIDSLFALEDIQKAHERSESGRARGKIVVQIG